MAELRRDFDASFARARAGEPAATAELLLVRAGERGLAVRLDELSSLERARTIVPVPGSSGELVGVAAIRGRLVAVYDVARVVADSPSAADRAGAGASFIAVARVDPTIGLLLSGLEGQTSVARELVQQDSELLTLLPLEGGARRRLSVVAFKNHVSRVKDEVRT